MKNVEILEFVDGGDLYDYFNKNGKAFRDQKLSLMILSQVLEGLNNLHKAGYAHNDIKAQNVMLTKDVEPRIVDFNISSEINFKDSYRGTAYYSDPQILKEGLVQFNEMSDIYASGALLYFLTTEGYYPFMAFTIPGIIEKLAKGDYQLYKGMRQDVAEII